MTLIRRDEHGARVVEDDPWVEVSDDEALGPASIISLVRFDGGFDGEAEAPGRLGLRVPGEVDPDALGPRLEGVDLVVVEFPKFTDGRGYSLARVLRDRHGYRGELRAVGHVLRDQLHYMARCGFDTFELYEGKDVDDALRAFDDFSAAYQPAADGTRPAWKR